MGARAVAACGAASTGFLARLTMLDSLQNILLLTDSYKVSHYRQYPPQTERVYSYFESRGGAYAEIVFFGLQYLLKRYLQGAVVTAARIDEAEALFARHFGDPNLFHRRGWEHILHQNAGRLPVSIRAVPEGTVVPFGNVLLTIENTDPACWWLTNYLETLLVQSWYPTTVATRTRAMKRTLLDALYKTGDPAGADFKLHDFGFRGVSSVETAALGGAAHLVHFQGTDNLAGLVLAREIYAADMPGFSIPAAEHSTLTCWGRAHEVDALRNMLRQFPTGIVAVVSDSYDLDHACREIWGRQLRHEVLYRDGVLVVRPDSGDPPTIVVRVLEMLGTAFGFTHNSKGYKLLDSHVRLIQGDGIDAAMLAAVLNATGQAGWSADNIAFGSGGGLLQQVNRDACQFAFKCSAAVVAGQERDVFKAPATDLRKSSKPGRLKLIVRQGALATVRAQDHPDAADQLQEVFRDGELLAETTFDAVRARAVIGG